MPWVVAINPAEASLGIKIGSVTVSVHPDKEVALTEILPAAANDKVKVT